MILLTLLEYNKTDQQHRKSSVEIHNETSLENALTVINLQKETGAALRTLLHQQKVTPSLLDYSHEADLSVKDKRLPSSTAKKLWGFPDTVLLVAPSVEAIVVIRQHMVRRTHAVFAGPWWG